MSHDTHGQPSENKTIISFKNSFWLVVIIVGLFIGALNFIQAMSGGEGENTEGAKTEMKANSEPAGGTMEQKTEAAPASDSAPKDTAKAAM